MNTAPLLLLDVCRPGLPACEGKAHEASGQTWVREEKGRPVQSAPEVSEPAANPIRSGSELILAAIAW